VGCQKHGFVVFGHADLENQQEDLIEKCKEECGAVRAVMLAWLVPDYNAGRGR